MCSNGVQRVISSELLSPLAPCFLGKDDLSCPSLHLPHENSQEIGNTATRLQLPGSVQKGLKVTRSVQDAQHFDTFCIVREEDEMR